jgi:hypothetical protein
VIEIGSLKVIAICFRYKNKDLCLGLRFLLWNTQRDDGKKALQAATKWLE